MAVWTFVPLATGISRAVDQPPGLGTVRGQVVWEEPAMPAAAPVNVNHDQAHCLSKGPIPREDWVINTADRGVRYTFVWLISDVPRNKSKLPTPPGLQSASGIGLVLDQPTCRFEPHAAAIRQGQEVLVKNSAPIVHNVNWSGGLKNPGGNMLLPSGSSYTIQGLKAERLPLRVTCNIHPWMKAWIGVFDHPYFAITDADGRFEIKQVPAGNCRIVVWHESVGYRGGAPGRNGTPITVKAGEVAELGHLGLKSKYD